jgi:hypothetical protein
MRTRPADFPFSVADTSAGPELHWANDRLIVEFNDYQGNLCRIRFNDVSHFEWVAEDELDPKIFAYDNVVEVIHSPIIHRLIEIGEISESLKGDYRHWVIGFNEAGAYLVVIFRDFDSIDPENRIERESL